MKTTKLSLHVPVADSSLTDWIDDVDTFPEVAAANRAIEAAQRERERIATGMMEADALSQRLPGLIAAGRAKSAELDAAILAARRAALMLPEAEAAIERARSARDTAVERVRDRMLEIAQERLQAILAVDAALVKQLNLHDQLLHTIRVAIDRALRRPDGTEDPRVDRLPCRGEMPERGLTAIASSVRSANRRIAAVRAEVAEAAHGDVLLGASEPMGR